MPRFAAAVLGASGHVGNSVVRSLLMEPRCCSIILLNGRKLDGYEEMPRVKQHVVDMDKLATEAISVLQDNDVSACFVVTTCSGKPSNKFTREELEALELHLPTAFAKASRAAGCVRHISLLSAAANVDAKPLWLAGTTSAAIKGKVEKNLEEIGLESVAFFRPSRVLIGQKNKNNHGHFNSSNNNDHHHTKAASSGWSSIACRMVSSLVLPGRHEARTDVDALGEAMVTVAVSTLEEAGPTSARYEGESLVGLFSRKQ